ncbi:MULTISPECIES: glycerol dehydrogenase [Methylorubrum]|uniref:glycerol dehydrogenase n=1 Tax=Methylorubrum TaxID=2282523 RepID=UPI001477CB83|nr:MULTISPECIES: glycerol dehydrogenase [Methylorubrum]MDF9861043.1 glycerol dehydrogenase [Methylorubrum pseudosasae]MDH6640123.1 glycerol dehydrogenase [Methylobacterium sp. SuP10 SLI 274]MDH6669294.1 glycerol dehydrogenase [Methylorubrum zatmanii]MCP1535603.1 glycerol dehydrogenase [Methylorubrum extorquens]MCP1556692.1 glycerol dehydrogenase [Methylorubrum extorquens]
MAKWVFASPSRYVQGAGMIAHLGEHLSALGRNAFILADDTAWGIVGRDAEAAMQDKLTFRREAFGGEASNAEIRRMAGLAREAGAEVIVGMGGGKAMDTAKATADDLGLPVAIVPTIASTDAPCSALSVIYSPDGVFETYRFYSKNPDLVLVDTAVCARAPVRLFASGIADGLATNVEAKATWRSRARTMAGGAQTIAGGAIAQVCEDTLFAHGLSAYRAVEKGLVTPAVEAVVEAATLLSGLGFENGGLAAAHAIHNGFTALEGDIHHLTHGEKVAYGILVQLVLDQQPIADFERFVRLFRAIRMPVSLRELHIEGVSRRDLVKVGELANSPNDTLQNLSPHFTDDAIADAILATDLLAAGVSAA